MGAKPGDKTQVPQQYGCQYKFDACNMSFSPRNLTSVSVVSRYARRNVTFACPAMRRWQRVLAEAGARQPELFLRKQVRVRTTVVPRPPRLCPYCDAPQFFPAFQRAARATRSLGVPSPRITPPRPLRRPAVVARRVLTSSSPPHPPFSSSPRLLVSSVLLTSLPSLSLRIDPPRPRFSQLVYLITTIVLLPLEIMISRMPKGSLSPSVDSLRGI